MIELVCSGCGSPLVATVVQSPVSMRVWIGIRPCESCTGEVEVEDPVVRPVTVLVQTSALAAVA